MNTAPESDLSGVTVVLTRPREQSTSLTRMLETGGATVVSLPMIEIQEPETWSAIDGALSRLGEYQWLIFTSVNAVRFFARRARELGVNLSALTGRIAAVGPSTRAALEVEGLTTTLQAEEYTSAALAKRMLEIESELQGARILIPGSNLSSTDQWQMLSGAGAKVELVEVYRNIHPQIAREEIEAVLRRSQSSYILFASPSALKNLSKALSVDNLGRVLAAFNVICIGPTTAETATRLGIARYLQPQTPEASSILKLISDDVQARK